MRDNPLYIPKLDGEARAFREGYASIMFGGGVYLGDFLDAWVAGRNLALHEAAKRKDFFHA